jgi:hypothetical protein
LKDPRSEGKPLITVDQRGAPGGRPSDHYHPAPPKEVPKLDELAFEQMKQSIIEAQLQGLKVMVFAVPVDPEAIALSGLSPATIEDRVQQAMIAELNTCLAPAPEPA